MLDRIGDKRMSDLEHPQALRGQKVVIIGGTRMGLATARLAAAHGAILVLSSRNKDTLASAAAEIAGEVAIAPGDFSKPAQAEALLRSLAPFDHLVVTASASGRAGGIPDTSPDLARAPFERFWMCYHAFHFAPNFIRATGSVVLLSGSSGRRALAGYGVWSVLHSSIEGLARAGALELAPIRVNVVSPGGIGFAPTDNSRTTRHSSRTWPR